MATVAEMFVKIGANIKDFEQKMSSMQKAMDKVGRGMKNVGKNLSMSVTAPIAGLGAAIVVTGASFEKGMNKVSALTGATGKDLEKMKKQAMDLGSSTVFSAKEAADGMSFLAMAGFEVNEIMAAMPGMLDMAAASGMDLASAADIASNIMSGFSLNASEATRVADVLAKAASSANTDVFQLGDAMKYAAPIANTLGLSVEETAAAIGFMSDAGIQGSMAGTALRGGLTRLANPTGKAKKLINQLGIDMFDSEGKMKSLTEVIGELNGATKDMTKEQKTQALSTIFGQEALSGWLAVMDRGEGELGDFVGTLEGSTGAAEKMADTMNSGMAGAFEEIGGALETLAIQFAEILAPSIMKISEVILKALDWFSGLSTGIKTIILVVAGLIAAVGPLLVVLGLVTMALANLSWPIVGIVAGIAALIAILITAYTQSELFRQIVTMVFTQIQEVVMIVVEAIKQVFTEFWTFLLELWAVHGEEITATVTTLFQTIWTIIETALDVVKGVIKLALGFIKTTWETHGETIKNLVTTVFGALWSIISTTINAIQDIIGIILAKVQEIWKKHGDQIMTIIKAAMTVIQTVIGTALKAIQFVFESVWPYLKVIVESAWNVMKTVVKTAVDVIGGVIGFLASILTGDFKGAWESAKGIVKSVWDGIVGIIKGAINLIIGALNVFIKGMNKLKFDIPDWVPGIGGKKFGINIPLIPKLAKGGVAGGATFAEIGEGAHPEMVAPLNDATMKPFAQLIALHMPDKQEKQTVVLEGDPLDGRPINLVSPDGRVLAEFVSDPSDKITNRKTNRRKRKPKGD